MLKRREIAFIVAIVTGIVIGRLIKKVTMGMLMANRMSSKK